MASEYFLKVNVAGAGYQQLGVEGLWGGRSRVQELGATEFDSMLPALDSSETSPAIAYCVRRHGTLALSIALGGHWPDLKDEFGRRGLSAWWGVLLWNVQLGPADSLPIAARLLRMKENSTESSRAIASCVSAIADRSVSSHGSHRLCRILASLVFGGEVWALQPSRGLNKVLAEAESLPLRSNVKTALPYHPDTVVIALVHRMMIDPQVKGIAGGALGPISRSELDLITSKRRFDGFEPVVIPNQGSSPGIAPIQQKLRSLQARAAHWGTGLLRRLRGFL